eukprot:TRINITY_DN1986_c0_g3_i1.p1 TRINITY_DN1986_c0_g3~~TRINITY_DN1986_c0_g3_i1.p1  ORF type:complete len:201 (-),score=55.92 TRINITY_DN1986_c0_g3_i1:220-822(-)
MSAQLQQRARVLEQSVIAAKTSVLEAEEQLQHERVAKDQLNVQLQQAHSLQLQLSQSSSLQELGTPTEAEKMAMDQEKFGLEMKIGQLEPTLAKAKESLNDARGRWKHLSALRRVRDEVNRMERENWESEEGLRRVRDERGRERDGVRERVERALQKAEERGALLQEEEGRLIEQLKWLKAQCKLRQMSLQTVKHQTSGR